MQNEHPKRASDEFEMDSRRELIANSHSLGTTESDNSAINLDQSAQPRIFSAHPASGGSTEPTDFTTDKSTYRISDAIVNSSSKPKVAHSTGNNKLTSSSAAKKPSKYFFWAINCINYISINFTWEQFYSKLKSKFQIQFCKTPSYAQKRLSSFPSKITIFFKFKIFVLHHLQLPWNEYNFIYFFKHAKLEECWSEALFIYIFY